MKSSRLSVITFVLLGLVCVINGNVISNLLGKSDDKAETDDKTTATTTSTVKPADAAAAAGTTTTTADPGSSCGGLKGFLHMCDKNEPTEPPKNVKTRSVADDDDDDDDDDSSSSSEENSHERKDERRKYKKIEEESAASEQTSTESEKVKKRQTEEVEEEEEEPEQTEKPEEFPIQSPLDGMLKKRQTEEGNDEMKVLNATEKVLEEEEQEGDMRRRRDCRDGGDESGKDCRRKRELVPCVEPRCTKAETATENP